MTIASLISTVLPRSRLDCALCCATDPGCVTFTYSGQGSSGPGSCRGHSTQMAAGDAHNAEDGAKTYCRLSEPSPGIFLLFVCVKPPNMKQHNV